jgi:hypothetical protein
MTPARISHIAKLAASDLLKSKAVEVRGMPDSLARKIASAITEAQELGAETDAEARAHMARNWRGPGPGSDAYEAQFARVKAELIAKRRR